MYRVKTKVKVVWSLVAVVVLLAFWFAYRANTERVPTEQEAREYYNKLDERQELLNKSEGQQWCEANPEKCKG